MERVRSESSPNLRNLCNLRILIPSFRFYLCGLCVLPVKASVDLLSISCSGPEAILASGCTDHPHSLW
jgi:hypothetical protein